MELDAVRGHADLTVDQVEEADAGHGHRLAGGLEGVAGRVAGVLGLTSSCPAAWIARQRITRKGRSLLRIGGIITENPAASPINPQWAMPTVRHE